MMAPHSKVTVCRMARHAGIFHPRGAIVARMRGELTRSAVIDDCDPRGEYSTQLAPDSIVVELSFESASPCGHSTSASRDSNGTGVLCHVRGIWEHIPQRNWCDFSTRATGVANEMHLASDFRRRYSGHAARAVASPQTDSVASDSAAMDVQRCRQSGRPMESFSQDAN